MNHAALLQAEKEAKEFLARVAVLKADEYAMRSHYSLGPSRTSGAVRRQSMELSRALTNLRRPN